MIENATIITIVKRYVGDVEVTTCRHLADMLGVTDGTIRQYMAKKDAPKVYTVLPTGKTKKPLWRMDEALPYVTKMEEIRKEALAMGKPLRGRPRRK